MFTTTVAMAGVWERQNSLKRYSSEGFSNGSQNTTTCKPRKLNFPRHAIRATYVVCLQHVVRKRGLGDSAHADVAVQLGQPRDRRLSARFSNAGLIQVVLQGGYVHCADSLLAASAYVSANVCDSRWLRVKDADGAWSGQNQVLGCKHMILLVACLLYLSYLSPHLRLACPR